MPELHAMVEEAYTPRPECRDLEYIFDISGWLAEHIVSIRNHIYPHMFRFFLSEDKKAKMQYKNWANDKTWMPVGEPITILSTFPEGVPKLVRPTLGGKEAISLSDLSPKVPTGSHRMMEAQLHWWQGFIANERELRERWDGMAEDELTRMANERWFIPKLKVRQQKATPKEMEVDGDRQDKELERLLKKENSFPPVSIANTSSGRVLHL